MTNLPGGWSEHKLGRYADFIRGVTYKKPDASSNASEDRVPLLRATNFDQGQLALEDLLYVPDALIKPVQYLREGDTLLATSSGSISVVGKAVYIDHISTATTFGAFCGVLRPSLEVSPKLLYYFCCSPSTRSKWSEVASGTNINNLKPRDIEATAIPTPLIDEQDEIVRILDTQLARLDSVLGAVRAVRGKAARFRRSLLHAAFTGQLTQPDPSRVGDLPQGWVFATLGEVARWGSGGTPQSGRSDYYGGDIPWLQSGELNDGVVMRTDKSLTPTGLAESSAKWVDAGALLVAMYGATRGKVAIAGIPLTTNQAVAFAYPDPKRTRTPYLRHFLLSQRSALAAGGKGGAQPNLSQSVLKGWPVVLPPFPEQDNIVRILDTQLTRLDAAVAAADRAEAQCNRLRRSLLQAAFSGELTREWRESRV